MANDLAGNIPLFDLEEFETGATLSVAIPLVELFTTYPLATGALAADVPLAIFEGETSNIDPVSADLELDLFTQTFTADSGAQGSILLPELSFSGEVVTGRVGSLEADLPEALFTSQCGASLSFDLPITELLFSGKNGIVASMQARFGFEAALTAQTETLAALGGLLPNLLGAFTGETETLATMAGTLPLFQFTASSLNGETASLDELIPALTFTATAYENPVGSLMATLPFFTPEMCAGVSGRFDDYTLRHTRPE